MSTSRETRGSGGIGHAKVALVTGASHGLGAVIASVLASDGWAVAVNFLHDEEGAGHVVANIETAGGIACAARFDITDTAALGEALERIVRTLGPVDLVVNNATAAQPELPIMEQTWQSYEDQLRFFVKAPLELLKLLLPSWRSRHSGRVINVGSECAELGNANFANYVAAKGAMLSMTRSWATELAPEGITVNLVAPGWIPVERHQGTPPDRLQWYLDRTPMGRFGEPRDVAYAVAFLASERANFITGQRLAVNGGRTLV